MGYTQNDYQSKHSTDRTTPHTHSTARSLRRRINRKFGLAGMLALFVVPVAALAATGVPGSKPDSHHELELQHVSSDSTSENKQDGAHTSNAKQEVRSELKLEHRSTTGSSRNSSTNLTVNGHDIPVPENGSTHRTFTNQSGNTDVHIQSNQTGSNNSGNTSSSSTVEVQTNTDSEVNIESSS